MYLTLMIRDIITKSHKLRDKTHINYSGISFHDNICANTAKAGKLEGDRFIF